METHFKNEFRSFPLKIIFGHHIKSKFDESKYLFLKILKMLDLIRFWLFSCGSLFVTDLSSATKPNYPLIFSTGPFLPEIKQFRSNTPHSQIEFCILLLKPEQL